jgi:hypothetical protein
MEMNMIQLMREMMNAHGINTAIVSPPFDSITKTDGASRQFLRRCFPKRLEDNFRENVLYINRDSFGVHFAVFKLPPEHSVKFEVPPPPPTHTYTSGSVNLRKLNFLSSDLISLIPTSI